jgi:hypothetical protein
MAIVTRSGLIAATAYVASFFAANGITAVVDVGWRKRDRQINQGPGGANRVVFTPSNDDGDGGSMGPVRFPGNRNVRDAVDSPPVATIRSLASWERLVLVSVWGVDSTDQQNESAQIEATETLLEWVVRAVHSAPGAFAAASFGKVKWTPPPERSFGLEARVELTFSQPIYDVPRNLVYPSAAAVGRSTYTPTAVPASSGDT